MQTVKATFNHLTGSGWKNSEKTFEVDETIGLNAGKDVYATARGTTMKIMRTNGYTHESSNANIIIDNTVFINIHVYQGKFQKSEPKPVYKG